jgi:CIC family chloride channel protein
VSFFIASRLQKQPIYEALARQDGLHLPTAETRTLEGHLHVILAMLPAAEILSADMTVQEALEKIHSSESTAWPVTDERGLIGVLSIGKLHQFANVGPESKRLRDILDGAAFPHLHADHPLSIALERMGASQINAIPVVSRADVHKLEGVVTLKDVLAIYGVGASKQS